MDINAKISSFHQDYIANLDAAKIAEKRGNLEGARKLYRQAALSLCEMAQLESGNTRLQRIKQAQDIKEHADNLGKAPAAATAAPAGQGRSAGSAGSSGSSGSNGSSGKAAQSNNGEQDDENPWRAEPVPSTTFDDVVGMEDVKRIIRDEVIDQIKYPELYEQYGLKGGTGVLLFGLPGTGKTTIARAIAHEIEAPMYSVQVSDILNKWVGESEKRIRQLFDKARSTPTALIFFDDFDALGSERSDSGGHNNKVVVELITQMDGFRENTNMIVMIAATNTPWTIDAALMSRFSHHVYVPLANHEARITMIKKMLGDAPYDENMDMDSISEMLKGCNGRDIKAVVKDVRVAALQRSKERMHRGETALSQITYEDFVAVAENRKSSVKASDIQKLRKYAAERDIELPVEM